MAAPHTDDAVAARAAGHPDPTTGADRSMLLCIVTNGRADATLSCAVSLLRLQTLLMRSPERIKADMHFVRSMDDALHALRTHGTARGVAIVDSSMGFTPEFPLRAMASGLPVVVASYPLPVVDWERVKSQPATEDPQFWGNVYSCKPSGRFGPGGYAHVLEARLGVAWIDRQVVADIEARHPELVSEDGVMFASEGVYGGKRRTADERFLDLYGGDVWADIERPGNSTGPMEFGGCVGARTVLR